MSPEKSWLAVCHPRRRLLARNNDALYGLTPVTVSYSQRLARIISRIQHLPDDSYQFRLFM
jgi:hypothetical protein